MEIKSFSQYLDCSHYRLSLGIRLRTDETTPCEQLGLDPSKVRVIVNGATLQNARDYPVHRLDTVSASEYLVSADFQLQSEFSDYNNWKTLRMTIVLDSLLTCDGQPVPVDTIEARENQRCM